jgi:phosphohistidine phosphatase SixA
MPSISNKVTHVITVEPKIKAQIMSKIKIFLSSLICILFLPAATMTNNVYANDDLWNALKEGGKVVLIRHAPVEIGKGKGNSLLRDPSCKKERNLSYQGQRDAEVIGSRFRERNIPVQEVMHSPFCRTTETAQLAFGNAIPADYLFLLEILSPDEKEQQTEILNSVINTYEGKGNLILITHAPNINAVSFELVKYLDLLVIDPKGQEGFEELGVISFSESQ